MKNISGNKDRVLLNSKSILSALIAIFIITSSIVISSAAASDEASSGARTGMQANQPASGYSEGDDIFEIYHLDNTHDTSFATGETVYIRLTTPRVSDLLGKNELIVRSYDDAKVIDMDPAFTSLDLTSPYRYDSIFTAPTLADYYLLEANIEDDNGNVFRTYDVINVGIGSTSQRHIRTYSDSDYTNLESTFVSYATVYVEVYQSEQPNQANSKVDFRDYRDNKETENIRNLNDPTLTWHQDTYARFALNLGEDIPWNLEDGYWYIISADIKNNAGFDICKRWSAQILIKRPPHVSNGITDVNSPVDVVGANPVTISSEFTNPEVLAVSAYTVSFKLREPDDSTEVLLVNQQSHGGTGELGGTLSIVLDTDPNIYTASYSFDPTESWTLGNYDLYFSVDNEYGQIIDGFNRNHNELNLFNSLIQPPQITMGITKCIPSSVDIFGTGTVTIYSEFTDTGNPDISTFLATFKIKQGGQPEIVLVNDKANGGAGEFGDTLSISFSGGIYTASYMWDPDPTFPVGDYDLFFEVDDGVSEKVRDNFDNNRNELTIINSDNIPTITVGSTTALPSSVDKIGSGVVTIYSEFLDDDLPEASSFKVTFKVRDPDGNEIVLAEQISNGGLSEFGDIVNVEFSGTVYTASVTWNPDEFVLTGWYDLQFEVADGNGNTAKDSFNANGNELEIISSIKAPKIDSTTCIPSSVSKIGSGTTTIYTTFTDEMFSDISNFTVSFKVRAPDDTVFNLTNNAGSGDSGEYGFTVTISFSGTVFTASYAWNPPDDVPVGDYDLYSSIRNDGGGIAVDEFGENRNELKVETTENPPEITDTQCIPASLSVLGTAKTQLFVTFTDNDVPAITEFMITFRVRDENKNEIAITDAKANGAANAAGEILNLTYSGTEYTASIFWDPPESAYSGKYDLYSAVLEKTGALIDHNFDKNKDELTLTDGLKPGTPSLVESHTYDPETGEVNFTVTYTDSDDDAPNDDGVALTIDSDTYDMIEVDPSDDDYSDGKEYYYAAKLEDGSYTYGVKVTNTDDEVFETPSSSLKVGTEDKSSDSKSSGSALAIIFIIIIVVIVLVLAMVMKKRKGAPMQQPVQQPVQEPDQGQAEGKGQELDAKDKGQQKLEEAGKDESK